MKKIKEIIKIAWFELTRPLTTNELIERAAFVRGEIEL